MNKNFYSLVVDAGGFENLQFQEKDCRNFIDKARHLRLGKGGGEALNQYFQRMRDRNDGFVSNMDLDDEGRLRNVFWADARSRAAYEYFGDVVTFDTTYLTNRYGMPFAPFVGVNHHGQSILLGAGLLSNEDTETFVWLFRMWLDCMNGRAPKAMITDQDRAMKSAIAIVFPETRHRYCLWHIMRKLPEKLGSHAQFNGGFSIASLSKVLVINFNGTMVGAEADDDKIVLLLSLVKGKDITELIATGREKLAIIHRADGGAVAHAAAEPKKELEKVEEKEESDEEMCFSLFD
ncbi:protein FAR-RED IMPAIRED RESPONSE 1-like [Juglans microcarpa x Juglans regia]|uniref:protein FAR-RED IMPAIRED RESPONSE 1-like n=1 Tax=Juglans microcarpa x Juglans regia TaxID=2249226 RepID=UPI001B7E448B|nr:protein FAR-RED IMPAIRED RESPONSE 1-like [Juglans microcarpa x Juglans regia]